MARPHIPERLRNKVAKDAKCRCGYCLAPQDMMPIRLTIEHIIPIRKGGTSNEENLWLSCSTCNNYKGTQISGRDPQTGRRVPLFNPRHQNWFEHFRWSKASTHIIGITAIGRATAQALQLNNELSLTARRFWIMRGVLPPTE